jgi:hypothetical protein
MAAEEPGYAGLDEREGNARLGQVIAFGVRPHHAGQDHALILPY